MKAYLETALELPMTQASFFPSHRSGLEKLLVNGIDPKKRAETEGNRSGPRGGLPRDGDLPPTPSSADAHGVGSVINSIFRVSDALF